MKTENGQPIPKFRAVKELHALKIKTAHTNAENGKVSLTFEGDYHMPMQVDGPSPDWTSEKINHYLVFEEDGRPHIVPAEHFEQHFKPVT